MVYSILLEHDEDGWFATHPDLLGCAGDGATPEEAIKVLDESREALLEVMKAEGVEVHDCRYREALEKIAKTGCYRFDLSYNQRNKPRVLRCPDRFPGNRDEWCVVCIAQAVLV